MLKGATIVFDLDGTLVDTAPDLTHALNHVLTRRCHAAVSAATVRSGVGFGIRVMIEETLRRLGATDDLDEMLAEFLVYYEANVAQESRPPGRRHSAETPREPRRDPRGLHQQAGISEPAPPPRA